MKKLPVILSGILLITAASLSAQTPKVAQIPSASKIEKTETKAKARKGADVKKMAVKGDTHCDSLRKDCDNCSHHSIEVKSDKNQKGGKIMSEKAIRAKNNSQTKNLKIKKAEVSDKAEKAEPVKAETKTEVKK